MTLQYKIDQLKPYINWIYFYHAWQVQQPDEQQRIRNEAVLLLTQLQDTYYAHAVVLIEQAHSEGDDIVLDRLGEHIALLRQQNGNPCLCLSDFIHPVSDCIGLFATSVDRGMETDFDDDPYMKMMAQLLADRLAEAAAELLHLQVRRDIWGYAPDEQLSIDELHQERFQGIRPAVGYPSLPDASLNFQFDRILDMRQIGIALTENGAMRPHASVSGLMICHPQSRYFTVGKIGDDQLADYARRRGQNIETTRKFLAANL